MDGALVVTVWTTECDAPGDSNPLNRDLNLGHLRARGARTARQPPNLGVMPTLSCSSANSDGGESQLSHG